MVQSHVERDGNGVHLSYYDVEHHKEGAMELQFINPADGQLIHEYDKVELIDIADKPNAPVTLHVSHPDGSSDDIPCSQG